MQNKKLFGSELVDATFSLNLRKWHMNFGDKTFPLSPSSYVLKQTAVTKSNHDKSNIVIVS